MYTQKPWRPQSRKARRRKGDEQPSVNLSPKMIATLSGKDAVAMRRSELLALAGVADWRKAETRPWLYVTVEIDQLLHSKALQKAKRTALARLLLLTWANGDFCLVDGMEHISRLPGRWGSGDVEGGLDSLINMGVVKRNCTTLTIEADANRWDRWLQRQLQADKQPLFWRMVGAVFSRRRSHQPY